ncbi:MAG: hypothetical protein US70_C0017G0012 [Parcubacteria group bacterium GW2011_GWD2_38_11]|nr:MAG: hypothetical protein US70_C0017G0012 [Parcubacteria group bacterium GW2011_GWD2_38_11]
MNHKLIILATGFFLLTSFVFLSVIEGKQADISTKNVWMVYFENPKDKSLNFTIENHSSNANFHWEIMADKDSVTQGNSVITNGAKKTIPVSSDGITNKKITVIITSDNNEKTIYKNL